MSEDEAEARGFWFRLLDRLPAWVYIAAALVFGGVLFFCFPEKVVNLQLAGTSSEAAAVVEEWEASGTIGAMRLQTVLDFLFIGLYARALWLVVGRAARLSLSFRAERLVRRFALVPFVAAAFDLVENVCILFMLAGDQRSLLAVGATAMAWPKYALLALAVGAAIVPSVAWLLRRFNANGLTWLPTRYERPSRASFDPTTPPLPSPDASKVGICCSGGGIRSAAFNLGALQVLAEPAKDVYANAAHIVGVSGGSYIAAAHAILDRNSGEDSVRPFQRRSAEERHLRLNTQYLAPGVLDRAGALARLLFSFVLNLVIVGLVLFIASGPVGWATRFVHPNSKDVEFSAANYAAVLVPVVVLVLVLVLLLDQLIQVRGELRRWLVALRQPLLVVTGYLLLVHIVVPATPLVVGWVREQIPAFALTSAEGLGGLLGVGGLAAVLRGLTSRRRSRFASVVAAIVVPVSAIAAVLTFAVWHWRHWWAEEGSILGWFSTPAWRAYGVALALVLLALAKVDVTSWSLHPFYKRQLAKAYALRRTEGRATPVGDSTPGQGNAGLRLSAYGDRSRDGNVVRPELIVAAAANISDGRWAAAGTDAVSFTFSATSVGIPDIAEIATSTYEEVMEPRASDRASDIDVMAAVAISGAALSPAMGKQTRRALAALLALAGVRLGVWLPNPVWVNANASRWPEKVRLTYLFKEMLGRFDHDDRYLYVTDGGHWENLGIVELLRRGCTTIYCFDASGDTVATFNTIGEAVAIAKAELGVEIDIRPEEMRPVRLDKRGRRTAEPLAADGRLSPVGHVVAAIRWPDGREQGHLVLCKLAITEKTPWDIKSYAEKDPGFPNHSTLDQFFDGERFEAYRALGEYSTRKAHAALEDTKMRQRMFEDES